MFEKKASDFIIDWLKNYSAQSNTKGFVVGISGGIDSALTSTLCALSGKKTILISMPIRQTDAEFSRAKNHIVHLEEKFANVSSVEIDLTATFSILENSLPKSSVDHSLAMANSRSRLRMLTLYAIAQPNGCLVAGTGNKIEDFGIGFYTKYGDGGVDLSPIADLTKTQVWNLSRYLGVLPEIIEAKPTDGLFDDGRSDEDQIGASYQELEWAMDYLENNDPYELDARQQTVLNIYAAYNKNNLHKMQPIPVCTLPKNLI